MNEAVNPSVTKQASLDEESIRSVAIVQRIVADYNVPLFNGLHDRLIGDGIKLTVLAGDNGGQNYLREHLDRVACAVRVRNIRFGRKIYLQPILTQLKTFDLVIVEQSNAALTNYPLILLRRGRHAPRVAFWGHGETLSPSDSGPIRRALKRRMTAKVDHIFAYTEYSRRIVKEAGVPDNHITVVNNSLDTSLNKHVRCATEAGARDWRRKSYGFGNKPVAIFCSRLLDCREIPFLVEACQLARSRVPNLQLAVIGDGEKLAWLQEVAAKAPWVKVLGALYGEKKAELLTACDFFVMPSYIGLSILDSFSAGLPIIGATFPGHGPEIEYLEPGRNGLMTENNMEAYANAIVTLASNHDQRRAMAQNAIDSSEKYSLDESIERFARGIRSALAA